MTSYKNKILEVDKTYDSWLMRQIEPMVEFPTDWMLEVEYALNNYSLRCDDFSVIDKKDHILFAGCEYTLAMGSELEESWAFNIYRYSILRKIIDPIAMDNNGFNNYSGFGIMDASNTK